MSSAMPLDMVFIYKASCLEDYMLVKSDISLQKKKYGNNPVQLKKTFKMSIRELFVYLNVSL